MSSHTFVSVGVMSITSVIFVMSITIAVMFITCSWPPETGKHASSTPRLAVLPVG